jgi:3-oxoacyl-[acyl-carrier-protein] synthase II
MARRVVVTGRGLVSALGDSPAELHTSLCAGRNGVRPIEMFSTEGLSCQLGGEIKTFLARTYLGEKNIRPLDRTCQLAAAAARLALDDSGWCVEHRSSEEIGLALGTMFGSVHTISNFDRRASLAGPACASPMDFANTVINAAAGQTAIWHNLRGVNSTIAGGPTSGLQATAYATDLIRSGRARAILAGGAEELCFESFCGFNRAELLCGSNHLPGDFPIPFDTRRNGFALGEGAALLMLEDADSAAARGARVLAEIRGYGTGYDYLHGRDTKKFIGTMARAIRFALADAQVSPEEIDGLSASANGSVLGDRHEALAVDAVFKKRARLLPVTAIKSMLGETLGASAALQAVALLEAMRTGILPGIRQLEHVENDFPLELASPANRRVEMCNGLITSIGFDGNCCSVVLTRRNDF